MKSTKIFTLLLFFVMAASRLSAVTTINIVSGPTWLASGVTTPGWQNPGFADGGWGNAVVATTTACHYNGLPGPPLSINNGGLAPFMWSGPAANSGVNQYFRFHFNIDNLATVTGASITFSDDDLGDIYLNGNLLAANINANVQGSITFNLATLLPLLVCGDNVIAIRAQDVAGGCFWASCNGFITIDDCQLAGLTCNNPNILPKVDPANVHNLICSQVFDNGTFVGVNTTTPTQKLHVKGGSILIEGALSGNDGLAFKSNPVSCTGCMADWSIQYNDLSIIGGHRGLNFWKPFNATPGTSGNNILFLDDNLKVGVHTAAPTALFHVDASGTTSTTGVRLQGLVTDNTFTNTVVADASGNLALRPYTGGAGLLACATLNFVPKVNPVGTLACSQIFDNGTNVGINNTNPQARLDVRGTTWGINSTVTVGPGFINSAITGNASGAVVNFGTSGNANTASANGANIGLYGFAGNAPANYGVWGTVANGNHLNNCLAGYFSGDVVVTGFFSAGSDMKLKTNIRDFKNALDQLKKLQPKTYDFKVKEYSGMNLPDNNQIGLIAQEVQTVFPNLVKEKTAMPNINPETHEQTGTETKFLTVNYIGLIPVLIQAAKELDAQLTDVKGQVADLKAQNAALQSQLNDICNNGCAGLKGSGSSAEPGNQLMQNVPNPFSRQTTIGYVLNTGTVAYMNVNSLDGKQIKHIALSVKGAGSVTINSNEMAAGTYTYTLIVDNSVVDTKIMVITSDY